MEKIILKNVSKSYKLNKGFLDKFKRNSSHKYFLALKKISINIKSGESIGLIGLNGSGKSTLSNLIAEVNRPTSGEIQINGESRLIAISAGLNQNLTGKENIRLKCLMHGLKEKEINIIFEQIAEFSELGEFLNQPIKSYSSGMRSRLGFSIAIHTKPDILIVDEALSVGDATFANKCLNKIRQFQKQGKTIIFVSHTSNQIKEMCDRIIWLHGGEVYDEGFVDEILPKYESFIKIFNSMTQDEQKQYKNKIYNSQIIEQSKLNRANHLKSTLFEKLMVIFSFILFILSIFYQFISM